MTEKAAVLSAEETPLLELEELRTLIAEGQERGYLTFEEIAGLPRGGRGHEGADPGAARAPGGARHRRDRSRRPPPVRPAEGGATEARAPEPTGDVEAPEIDLTVEPSLDSLRLYLRSIGRVEPAHRRTGGRPRASASSAATCPPSSR